MSKFDRYVLSQLLVLFVAVLNRPQRVLGDHPAHKRFVPFSIVCAQFAHPGCQVVLGVTGAVGFENFQQRIFKKV